MNSIDGQYIELNEAIQRFDEFKKDSDFDIVKKIALDLLYKNNKLDTHAALELQTKLPVRLVNADNNMGGKSIGLRYNNTVVDLIDLNENYK